MGVEGVPDHSGWVAGGVLGGAGPAGALDSSEAIARAFLEGGETDDPVAETFYKFATARPGNDLQALAACIRGLHPDADPARLARIHTPILIVVGDHDEIARGAPRLVELIPSAPLGTVAGRDHPSLGPAREFKQAAVDLLTAHY